MQLEALGVGCVSFTEALDFTTPRYAVLAIGYQYLERGRLCLAYNILLPNLADFVDSKETRGHSLFRIRAGFLIAEWLIDTVQQRGGANMAVVSAHGIATPFEEGVTYPVFGTLAPALHSFRLTHLAPNEREVALIQVLAGGNSEDLSPHADLNPTNVPDGKLEVLLQDANPAGEEFGYFVSHSLLNIPGARRYQIRDVGCVGMCVRELPLPGFRPPIGVRPLIALVGFKLFFIGGVDKELDRVGVWFRDNNLHVALRDANSGDTFAYLVDFIVIPTTGMNVSSGIERGSAAGLQTIPFPTPSRAHWLLTGWAFNFKKDDQEILDLGIIRRNNDFTVFYGDNGGGDQFDWRVEWAHIAPQVFAPAFAQPSLGY